MGRPPAPEAFAKEKSLVEPLLLLKTVWGGVSAGLSASGLTLDDESCQRRTLRQISLYSAL